MKGVLVFLALAHIGLGLKYPDYKQHPCIRPCNGVPKDCYYNITFARYMTMQPDCRNCLNNVEEDCYREDCLPGGGTRRHVWTYNGYIPGPPIDVCQNDRIIVDVFNMDPSVTTSVHWHGMHQRGTLHMDGVPQVTQCPILPGTTFRYNFIAAVKGSHFYHSHSESQRADGAFGHFTVHPITEYHKSLYTYDKPEHRISVLDWMNLRSDDHFYTYLRSKQFYDGQIRTLLINGFGKTANNNLPFKKFLVEQGVKYRFRMVNAGNTVCPVVLTIDNHMLQIISTDGNDILPIEANSLKAANGERFDFVINANQRPGSYAMRFQGTQVCNTSTIAILQYTNAPVSPPRFEPLDHVPGPIMANCIGDETDMNCYSMFDNTIQSVFQVPYAITQEPTFKYILGLNMDRYPHIPYRGVDDFELISPFINNISYVPSPTPLIQQQNNDICNAENPRNCDGQYCSCTHQINIRQNSLVEIVLVDEARLIQILHPYHIHGYTFYVVAMGRPNNTVHRTTAQIVRGMLERNEIQRNFNSPPMKDTVPIPSGGYTVVRFIANNPGIWLTHCHVDFHSEEGMQMVMQVGVGPFIVPFNFPRCGNFY